MDKGGGDGKHFVLCSVEVLGFRGLGFGQITISFQLHSSQSALIWDMGIFSYGDLSSHFNLGVF